MAATARIRRTLHSATFSTTTVGVAFRKPVHFCDFSATLRHCCCSFCCGSLPKCISTTVHGYSLKKLLIKTRLCLINLGVSEQVSHTVQFQLCTSLDPGNTLAKLTSGTCHAIFHRFATLSNWSKASLNSAFSSSSIGSMSISLSLCSKH